jgi:hypothetical protein
MVSYYAALVRSIASIAGGGFGAYRGASDFGFVVHPYHHSIIEPFTAVEGVYRTVALKNEDEAASECEEFQVLCFPKPHFTLPISEMATSDNFTMPSFADGSMPVWVHKFFADFSSDSSSISHAILRACFLVHSLYLLYHAITFLMKHFNLEPKIWPLFLKLANNCVGRVKLARKSAIAQWVTYIIFYFAFAITAGYGYNNWTLSGELDRTSGVAFGFLLCGGMALPIIGVLFHKHVHTEEFAYSCIFVAATCLTISVACCSRMSSASSVSVEGAVWFYFLVTCTSASRITNFRSAAISFLRAHFQEFLGIKEASRFDCLVCWCIRPFIGAADICQVFCSMDAGQRRFLSHPTIIFLAMLHQGSASYSASLKAIVVILSGLPLCAANDTDYRFAIAVFNAIPPESRSLFKTMIAQANSSDTSNQVRMVAACFTMQEIDESSGPVHKPISIDSPLWMYGSTPQCDSRVWATMNYAFSMAFESVDALERACRYAEAYVKAFSGTGLFDIAQLEAIALERHFSRGFKWGDELLRARRQQEEVWRAAKQEEKRRAGIRRVRDRTLVACLTALLWSLVTIYSMRVSLQCIRSMPKTLDGLLEMIGTWSAQLLEEAVPMMAFRGSGWSGALRGHVLGGIYNSVALPMIASGWTLCYAVYGMTCAVALFGAWLVYSGMRNLRRDVKLGIYCLVALAFLDLPPAIAGACVMTCATLWVVAWTTCRGFMNKHNGTRPPRRDTVKFNRWLLQIEDVAASLPTLAALACCVPLLVGDGLWYCVNVLMYGC